MNVTSWYLAEKILSVQAEVTAQEEVHAEPGDKEHDCHAEGH